MNTDSDSGSRDGRDSSPSLPTTRVLIADDEPALLRTITRLLTKAGYQVTPVSNGREAADLLATNEFDVILSDIMMPELDGIQLLRTVRAKDLDVPMLLMTGAPDIATAAAAVEYGALKYLTKPFDSAELLQAVEHAARLHRMALVKREALQLVGGGGLGVSDRAGLEATFARALRGLWMAFQPIIRTTDRTLFGYEALMRTSESTLPNPGAMLDAAERLGLLHELGRAVRAAAAATMEAAEDRGVLFVNLHTRDLNDETITSPDSPLSKLAGRVVLEITERAALDEVKDAPARVAELRKMGFRIAIDDLGAGYAGLTSFASLEPEVVKLDMSLVRDIDTNGTKQKLVRSMTSLCHDMKMLVVAEGIETPSERDTLVGLGCDLLQGYRFAKPGKPFPDFTW
jgi:EAL domain-containing protein (putative c-di-GMP-specific phosphodiesterase class I)